ncbi:MAG: hypothetical protein ACO1OF_14065 [Adhaeribacter sp.]
MAEIITALVMVVIALGPLPKKNNLLNPEKQFSSISFKKKNINPANVMWSSEPGLKKTTVNQEGTTVTAFYDRHNALLGTARTVEVVALPPQAINKLVEDYPGYLMGEIVEFTSEDITYFVTLKNSQENLLVEIDPETKISVIQKPESFY